MKKYLVVVSLAAALAATGAWADPDKDESKGREKRSEKVEKEREKERDRAEKRREKGESRDGRGGKGNSYFERTGHNRLDIPKGHLPPPGECRIWYPDRPAGHQPPPHKCGQAVPHGAWLIEHPRESRGRLRVTAYDWAQSEPRPPRPVPSGPAYAPPPRVWLPPPLAVGEFDFGSGVLIRVVIDR